MRDHDKDSEYPITIDISDLKLDDMLNTTGDDFTIKTSDTTPTYTVSLDPSWSSDTIDISSLTSSTIDIDSITSNFYNQNFVDTLPSVHTVDEMCKEYPALAKAYETFKSVYKMCEQDYKGKLKAKGVDDDIPF